MKCNVTLFEFNSIWFGINQPGSKLFPDRITNNSFTKLLWAFFVTYCETITFNVNYLESETILKSYSQTKTGSLFFCLNLSADLKYFENFEILNSWEVTSQIAWPVFFVCEWHWYFFQFNCQVAWYLKKDIAKSNGMKYDQNEFISFWQWSRDETVDFLGPHFQITLEKAALFENIFYF